MGCLRTLSRRTWWRLALLLLAGLLAWRERGFALGEAGLVLVLLVVESVEHRRRQRLAAAAEPDAHPLSSSL
jgi:hypothetical protein